MTANARQDAVHPFACLVAGDLAPVVWGVLRHRRRREKAKAEDVPVL